MKKHGIHLIVVFILFAFGGLLSLLFYREVYHTSIQIYHSGILGREFFIDPLVQDKILKGEVTAKYNNFGTLKLRINTYGRFNYDTIRFRLRERGASDWVVQNAYLVDRFPDKLLYGFGFPPFSDSQGKSYEFQLFSDKGTQDNAIGFFSGMYSVATQYIFPMDTISHNPHSIFWFIREKILSILHDPYFMLYYLIFLLPGFIYLAIVYIKNITILYTLEFAAFLYMLIVYIFDPISISWDTILYIISVAIILFEIQTVTFSKSCTFVAEHLSFDNLGKISNTRSFASNIYLVPMLLIVVMLISISKGDDLVANRTAIGIFYLIVFALIVSARELIRNK